MVLSGWRHPQSSSMTRRQRIMQFKSTKPRRCVVPVTWLHPLTYSRCFIGFWSESNCESSQERWIERACLSKSVISDMCVRACVHRHHAGRLRSLSTYRLRTVIPVAAVVQTRTVFGISCERRTWPSCRPSRAAQTQTCGFRAPSAAPTPSPPAAPPLVPAQR